METEGDEQVMSEVHLGCPPRLYGPFISNFTFPLHPTDKLDGRYTDPIQVEASSSQMLDNDGDLILMRRDVVHNHAPDSDNLHAKDTSSGIPYLDEDGDLVLTRRSITSQRYLNCELTIQHNITSSLPSVGLQVWRAALVLADFVLHKSFTSSEFNDVTAVELGAGTGLVGIILARVARTIFLTDIGCEVLDNCATNAHLNSRLFKFHETSVRVRELNWKDSWPPSMGTCDFPSQQRSRYSWASSEIEEAEGATLLLAADVVYDDKLTDSLFGILEKLMARGSEKVLYLALEKRYNFTLDDLDVVANGYEHFRSFLKDGEECEVLDDTSPPCFVGKQMDLDQVPQYIREYERGREVELWKITYSSKKLSSSNGSS